MNNKKIISGLLALTFVFGGALTPNGALKNIVSVSASAETVKSGNFICEISDDGTAEIKRYLGSEKEIEIPNEIEEATVTGIGAGAFSGCRTIVSVAIPESVTSIGSAAFSQCAALEEIVIPDGVTAISDTTFSYCTTLKSVTLPKDLETIGDVAFGGCVALTDIEMPDSVVSVGNAAFNGCTGLESIALSSKLETIGDAAFFKCSSLDEIEIPEGITSIGERTFSNCSKIKSIIIPDGVESIGNEAFAKCTALESVTFPKKLTSIGANAFKGCELIKSVIIPDGVKTIGSGAFSGCNGLESMTIPASVTEIGENMVTYYDASADETLPAENVTIICYTKSAAHKYAYDNKLKYQLLDAAKPTFPKITTIDYSEEYHQIRFNWEPVEDAQQYGIAVYLAGKWRIQTQKIPATAVNYTTPKNLTPGKTYKVAIAAKVNGNWDTTNAIKNAVTVTVK